VARELAERGRDVLLLEEERTHGQGVSSRNSEVIHAGIYYPEGSLRARFCVEGRRRLYEFLETSGVAHSRCGKLIVASDESEIPRLQALEAQGHRNGVEGLRWLSGEEARVLEPEVRAVAALLSAETGVFDSHGYMLALLGRIEAAGGALALRAPLVSARPLDSGGFEVAAGGDDPAVFRVSGLVIAAGLGAQDAAGRIEGYPPEAIPTLRFGKGVYFRVSGRPPFERLVYPLPPPGALGIHYTRDLAGQGRFGPDLEFVCDKTYDVDPAKAEMFRAAVRRYWPGVNDRDLQPDYGALRPKIHGPGEPQPDFRIDGPEVHGMEGLISLFGIESPGLTSSLAIGQFVADRIGAFLTAVCSMTRK
jgi:L-2-hydroxyglutarate oxidase LhgO